MDNSLNNMIDDIMNDMLKDTKIKGIVVDAKNTQGADTAPKFVSIRTPVIPKTVSEASPEDENKKILIVDDDPAFLKMLKECLSDCYKVSGCVSGAQVLTYLSANKADIILLDYEMPNMSGSEVLKVLRNKPQTKNIPVLFLSGVDDRETVRKLLALKPDGYILKSSPKDVLTKKIENILSS